MIAISRSTPSGIRLEREREQQPTLEKSKHMKTIILMTAMFLSIALARPAAAGRLTFFDGYLIGTEIGVPQGDVIVVDGSGSGYSSLGSFSWTKHSEISTVTGKGTGTFQIVFPNGDTWDSEGREQGDLPGLSKRLIGITVVAEIQTITNATGQFANQAGDFTLQGMVDTTAGKYFGSIRGQFLNTAP
jgi:hypothetical protein